MQRVGFNAHLLSLGESYRGAGVSRYVHNLLTYLPQVDGGLSYVAFLGDTRAHYPGWRERLSRWRTESPPARILWEQIVQPWAAWRERLDLLHVPVYVGPILSSCPVVATIHDLSFYLYPELFRPLNRIYLQSLTRRTAERAQGLIAVSANTRDDIVRVLGVSEKKVSVIPNGVSSDLHPIDDPERIGALRRRYGLPDHMILFLGTLEPRKNIRTLLEAYALLRQRNNLTHHLVIAGGKGWHYGEIYAAVERLGLEDRVMFPGYIPWRELALWYNAADLFVYPSLYEGFGLPPLEAMACGTPVVVANTSSLPEVVGDAGVLVDPNDEQALAKAMSDVLSDPVRQRALREAGLSRAEAFSWQATAVQTAKLYRRILGNGDACDA